MPFRINSIKHFMLVYRLRWHTFICRCDFTFWFVCFVLLFFFWSSALTRKSHLSHSWSVPTRLKLFNSHMQLKVGISVHYYRKLHVVEKLWSFQLYCHCYAIVIMCNALCFGALTLQELQLNLDDIRTTSHGDDFKVGHLFLWVLSTWVISYTFTQSDTYINNVRR